MLCSYMSIVDMHADTKEAMQAILSKLHSQYGVGITCKHLVVVGDQKTYNHLHELKHAYWHLLHNFHSVLMMLGSKIMPLHLGIEVKL